MSIGSTAMKFLIKTKKKLGPITTLLLISLRSRPLRSLKRSWQGGHLAIRINATKVTKKDKNKTKDFSHVKCYTYKQKNHYINKYHKNSKNKWQSWRPLCWWQQTEEKKELEEVSCIWYPVIFKDQTDALLNSKSKDYIMSQVFAHQ